MLGRKDAFGKPGRIGRFEISDPVCMDALGPTWAGYIADGEESGRIVLVTVGDFADGGRVAQALHQAAEKSAAIRHPNVLAFLEAHQDGPHLAFASEYLDGEPLGSLMRIAASQSAPLPQGVSLQIIREAIDTLATLKEEHPQIVLPGALGPDCIFVASFGEALLRQPGVLGTAMRAPVLRKHATSLPYRAPEHLTDPRSISDLADVYSAGVLLWELLAGRPLFGQTSHATFGQTKNLPEQELLEMERRCLTVQAPRLSQISRPGGTLHPEVIELVDKALARDPGARFSSLRELSAAIEALPPGVVASSTEIATLVERLAGKVISERQRALAEGAPMPVFGSKPPSNRATARPDEEPHITIEIPRHPSPRGLFDLVHADAPAPPSGASSSAPDSNKMTRPMRQEFQNDEATTTSPTRAILMGRIAGGEVPAPLPRRAEPVSVSHVPGVDISSAKRKKSSSSWLLVVAVLLAAGAGVGFLILRGQTSPEDPTAASLDARPNEAVDEPAPELEDGVPEIEELQEEGAEDDSTSSPQSPSQGEVAVEGEELPSTDGRVDSDAETRVESPVPAPRPTDSKKPSGKERSGTSSGAFRPSGI